MAWGVVTANKEKADMMFDRFEREYKGHISWCVRSNKHHQMVLDTGKNLVWCNPYVQAKSQRLYRVWVDKDLLKDKEILDSYCKHMIMCPRSEYDWI